MNPSMQALAIGTAAALVATVLAACGHKEESADADPAAAQKAAAERARQGPYGNQLKALDKAKGLQADLNKKAEDEMDRVDNAK